MANSAVLRVDGNLRQPHQLSVKTQTKRRALESPKVRLRLNDAIENSEKMKSTTVQYNFMPPEIVKSVLAKTSTDSRQNYMSDSPVNRNKISSMKRLIEGADKSDPGDLRASRIRGEESEANLRKSRGFLKIVGDGESSVIPQEPIHIRCPSNAGYDNRQRSQGADMLSTMKINDNLKQKPPNSNNASPPINQSSGSMASLMAKTSPANPAVRAKKSVLTDPSAQGSMSSIMTRNNNASGETSKLVCKKAVYDEDGNVRNPRSSSGVAGAFGQAAAQDGQELRAPRVRLAGREFAEKNKGTMSTVFSQCTPGGTPIASSADQSGAPVPRVKPEAEEFAQSARGAATKNLFTRYGNLPGDPKPRPHINSQSAKTAISARGGAMKSALTPNAHPPYSKKKWRNTKSSKLRLHSAHR